MSILEKEKGSITIFVITAMLMFIIIAFAIFFNISNKNISQEAEIEKIQEEYGEDINNINEIYENQLQNSNNT